MKSRKRINTAVTVLLVLLMISGMVGCGKTETEDAVGKTASYLQKTVAEPVSGSVGGEWIIIGLARSGCGAPDGYFDGYYERLCQKLTDNGGVLDDRKNTEYSRVIIALAAMGKDPADTGGYDLLEPLADYDRTVLQGINGAIWALIALNACGREPPDNTGGTQGSRKAYLAAVLDAQTTEGGWGLVPGDNDVDMTAMALQSMAPYQDMPEVAAAVEKALIWLSSQQLPNGGFYSGGTESLESAAQTVIALYELGLGVDDERFVKNENTLLDAIMSFSDGNGGFRHEPGGDVSAMSTEQAFLALTEILRGERGEPPVYRISQ